MSLMPSHSLLLRLYQGGGIVQTTDNSDRIGIKPLRSNALLLAQKKNGRAEITEKSLQHFSDRKPLAPGVAAGAAGVAGGGGRTASRRGSPSKKSSSPVGSGAGGGAGENKGKKSARDSDNEEDDDEGSGDEAEKLDEEQMNEIDNIYRK